MKYEITTQHDLTLYRPPIQDGIQLDWEKNNSPGKLEFKIIKPTFGNIVIQEGDPVCFYVNEKPVFRGYIFTKKIDKENIMTVTAYDQMRYLKNKYTYVFEGKTADQIIKAMCNDFQLKTGEFDSTGYVIPAIVEENKSAMDITLSVLEDTLANTGRLFTLYDDFGILQLKDCANMLSTTLLCDATAENFDYQSSIDSETYNNIILYYKDKSNNIQIFKANDPENMGKWGNLQYFEEVKTPTIGQNKADSLLKIYNKPTRKFSIKDAFGDITVRGGTLIPVNLQLDDRKIDNMMLVQKVTHKFSDNQHTMDLTLEGAWE